MTERERETENSGGQAAAADVTSIYEHIHVNSIHEWWGLSRYEYSSSNTFITWVFELEYFYNSSIQLSIHEYYSIQLYP